ncbi:MAG: outer membrane protein assembly factor BamA [Candidatus Krumholzibacteriota bacterium]|nr:outer membrane protein assembly factor BamA [Candidatus Krumholzibacteriota bacterium]
MVMPRFIKRGLWICGWGIVMVVSLSSGYFSPCRADDFGIDLPTVKQILILGNQTFDDQVLKKRMRIKESRFYHLLHRPKFRQDFLRRDIEALRSYYGRNGFFEVDINIDSIVRDEKANQVTVRILVNEGPRTVIRRLTFSGQSLLSEERLRKGLQLTEGRPYNPNLVAVDNYSLFSKFFEKGYLGAAVTYELTVDSTAVDLSWEFDPGNPVKVNRVELSGNDKVREKLIRRELTIEQGEYFDLKEILESKQNLYDTGCFNSVEIEPKKLKMDAGEVDLLLQVRERKTGYVETGLGFGNVHANRVFCDWGQRNLLGRGYALNIKTEVAFNMFRDNEYSLSTMDLQNKYFRQEGELRFPHILSTWNTFSAGAYYERDAIVEPAVIKALGVNGTLSRRFSRQTSLLLGYGYERIKRENVVDEKAESRRRSLDCSFRRDTRDFYFNPQKGNYFNVEARYAGGLLGGEDHYYSLVSSYQDYDRLRWGTILAYRVRAGYADAFGDSRQTGLPLESRFFAGGSNSVRGYEENSLGPQRATGDAIGGKVLLLANVELRFPLPGLSKYNFGGALFLDGGNVWRSVEEVSLKRFTLFNNRADVSELDFHYGVGFGVRYYTPVGPIRIDAGFPLQKDADIDYRYWLHISLGQIF